MIPIGISPKVIQLDGRDNHHSILMVVGDIAAFAAAKDAALGANELTVVSDIAKAYGK